VKFQVIGTEYLLEKISVEIAQIQYAYFAAQGLNIADDLHCLLLAHGKFIFIGIAGLYRFHKGLYGKGIVLCRNTEFFLALSRRTVFFHYGVILMIKLTGIGKKFRAVLSKVYSPPAAQKYCNAELPLQLVHCGGERGLGNIQYFRRLVHGAGLRYCKDIFDLLERHKGFPFCFLI